MQYTHEILIDHGLEPGALWPFKHTKAELKELEESDQYNYSAQYNQDPHKRGGTVFLTEWWQYYEVAPVYQYKAVFADTALKDKEKNDYTVFQCWGKANGRIYLLDQWRGKVKSIYLERLFIAFWNKQKIDRPNTLRGAYIEDKASGTQLIQNIQQKGNIPVIAVQRNTSKIERAWNFCPYIKSGLVWIPESAPYLLEYVNEFETFSPMMTHKNDDQIDPTLDAIEQMLVNDGREYHGESETAKNTKSIAPPKTAKTW